MSSYSFSLSDSHTHSSIRSFVRIENPFIFPFTMNLQKLFKLNVPVASARHWNKTLDLAEITRDFSWSTNHTRARTFGDCFICLKTDQKNCFFPSLSLAVSVFLSCSHRRNVKNVSFSNSIFKTNLYEICAQVKGKPCYSSRLLYHKRRTARARLRIEMNKTNDDLFSGSANLPTMGNALFVLYQIKATCWLLEFNSEPL